MTGTQTASGQSTTQKSCKGVCYTKKQDRRALNAFRKNASFQVQVKNDKAEIKKLNSAFNKLKKNKEAMNKAYEDEKKVSENCKDDLYKVKKRGPRNIVLATLVGLTVGFLSTR